MAQKLSSRYEMGQTTRSEWENDMKEHRELLRNVIEEHREGREGVMDWSDIAAELAFEEEKVYPGVSMLSSSNPPSIVKGASGWIYHSTSLGCLRPYHFPRRFAINVVESAVFDPFILLTIMVNCTTMAWASPVDPCCTRKQDILAVRTRRRARHRTRCRQGCRCCLAGDPPPPGRRGRSRIVARVRQSCAAVPGARAVAARARLTHARTPRPPAAAACARGV